MPELPFVNTHTHIFTEKNIPPFLARKIIPWPFYYLVRIGPVIQFYKWSKTSYLLFSRIKEWRTKIIFFFLSNPITYSIHYLTALILTANVVFCLLQWSGMADSVVYVGNIFNYIDTHFLRYFFIHNQPIPYQLIGVFILMFLYPAIGKKLWLLATKIFSPLKMIPSKQTVEFVQRYLTIAEFAKYKSQKGIYDKLVKMYDPGTKIVVLPMDMEYMGAGRVKQSYLDQLSEINKIKDDNGKNSEHLIPFIFVDPRRIHHQSEDHPFFAWEAIEEEIDGKHTHRIILKKCVLKSYLEGELSDGKLNGHFKGIKIYPALGYYPFDEKLLPLWLYCAQKGIPITTHCIVGSIYYRGPLKKEWRTHPIFKESNGEKLKTHARSNYDLQANFTHPLNYLVLLDPYFLTELLADCEEETKKLFGYSYCSDKKGGTLQQDLKMLKINLAHYGGDEQWMNYFEFDRNDASAELIEMPEKGLELSTTLGNKYTKPAKLWTDETEWFTIISSLMLQYDNVYADISYILHSDKVKPLLLKILDTNPKLAKKILFGTDFFVVRNHKSEKQLYAELYAYLGKEKMDLIGRENPNRFLKTM